MIVVAGGSGRLGTWIVRNLVARGEHVRVLTRDTGRARHLDGEFVELVQGDVRDRASLELAMEGVRTVISAVHGFQGVGKVSPQTVDRDGNSNLVSVARNAGVEHFILISIQGVTADHPMELFRMKYQAEEILRGIGLAWTIIRPTAYMELWAELIVEPLVRSGKTRIFGRGNNPINFVSVDDVARFVELAVNNPAMQGVIVELGGPENLTMNQIVALAGRVTGMPVKVRHVPLEAMRILSVLMRPINPMLARQIQAGVVMDTRDMTFDPADLERRFPSTPLITLSEVVRRDFVS